MADLTPDEIARLQRERDSMIVLLNEYRATHDSGWNGPTSKADELCPCDTCVRNTAIIGERAE